MVISFDFKGLMAPVFTFFNIVNRELEIENITTYASFLKSKRINGVLVNGTTGEGPAMNITERKTNANAWMKEAKNNDLTVMVQIGGAAKCDVIDLALHAQLIGAHAVLCLPDLYFKPKTVIELVNYLKDVARLCSNIPFFYYHIPSFTDVSLPMPQFCELAEKEIPNFAGIKFTSNDLSEGADCLKKGRTIFLGADTILLGAIALGFESAILTTLNIYPEFSINMLESFQNNQFLEAKYFQDDLRIKIKEILQNGDGSWVSSMKLAFNKVHDSINAGVCRY